MLRCSARKQKPISSFFIINSHISYPHLSQITYLLPITYCLLLTAYCLLLTAYCLLLTAYCK
ncbi:hypothetical protein C9J52_03465 [Photobacterium iliopiscarium]|uniref:Uncharacterized protein n=1 Tax=Photobacterium iliopiscarium TaxID=56192 RepID=A0ABX5GVS3_9GAMM|nr:hypothetical protein C9J52_03465 [Photobacterium iliopiscarium]